ncbi:MAG TPA: ABC transporter substrate-binding protein [Ruminiclostridium sp.]|nr:ABC transporter substrate-binding protein [Ruminiclostridium sp.]
MLKKGFRFLVLFLMLLSILVSCSKGENTAEKSSMEKSTMTKASGSNQMSIYIPENDTLLLNAVAEFNSKNMNSQIAVNEFNYATGIEEIRNKITTALTVGEGPDIIYWIDDRMFPSVRKMLESGAFCDLNTLIEKDPEIKLSDYNRTVLNSGIINGKRYAIPLSYTIPSLWTTKNILARNNIRIDSSKWTWKDFFAEAKKYMDKNKGRKNYFVVYPSDAPQYIMGDICSSLVNYKNKKTNFNSSKFIGFLKDYKAVSASFCPSDENVTGKEFKNSIINNSIVTSSTYGYISPDIMFNLNSELAKWLREEVFILGNPSLDESSHKSAYPNRVIGINSNCKSKEKAFDFIKILLSEGYQSSQYVHSIPVSIKGYTNAVDRVTSASAARGDKVSQLGGDWVDPVPLPSQAVKNLGDIISSINNCNIVDSKIVEIVSAEVTEYLKSNRSAEATAKIIDDKVLLYLNE